MKTESVWDYPRPPRIDPAAEPVRVSFNGKIIAKSSRALRVLETSHPPAYYIPLEDVEGEYLKPVPKRTFCEWKGAASYYDVTVGERRAPAAAWSYEKPNAGFEATRGYLCFYAGAMDECRVGDEIVQAQAGIFYGGWITSNITGPFKGGPGTAGW
jgi:uncharacterized protein (DUF427 family)